MTAKVVATQGSCVAGICLLSYGLWLAWPPLAFVFVGVLLCAFGVFIQRGGK